jgi:type II secretory pathway pseudopilin PulG
VRRSSGFTIVEIIVVLLMMSIIAATVLGRSIKAIDLDLNAATDKIRNHLRFAQAEAMKRSDTVWGIKFESGQYWLFRGTAPDNAGDQVLLPGADYSGGSNKVSLPTGLSLTATKSTVFFDRIGKPYEAYTNATLNTELAAEMLVTVTAGESRTIRIEPETGLVR